MDLCNRFLDFKRKEVESNELEQVTYDDYVYATDLPIERFGKQSIVDKLRPADFAQQSAKRAKERTGERGDKPFTRNKIR